MPDEPLARAVGAQRIPRPADVLAGRPAPWHDLAAARRTGITVATMRDELVAAGRSLEVPSPAPVDELRGLAPGSLDGLAAAAVLVALFDEDGEARIVLTRRSGRLRAHRGEVAFPGGRIEPGETPLAAALREAHEEVALNPRCATPIAWLTPIVTFASGSIISPFVATLDARPALVGAAAEVERVFDVAVADLVKDTVFREERWRRGPTRRGTDEQGYVPILFFEVAGETVWGATARILTELCTLAVGLTPRR